MLVNFGIPVLFDPRHVGAAVVAYEALNSAGITVGALANVVVERPTLRDVDGGIIINYQASRAPVVVATLDPNLGISLLVPKACILPGTSVAPHDLSSCSLGLIGVMVSVYHPTGSCGKPFTSRDNPSGYRRRRRSSVIRMAMIELSMPTHGWPNPWAASNAVPLPQNGERTTPPGGQLARMIRSKSAIGFCVG